MTEEEKAAMNRRVAEAMRWRWFLATVISEDSRHVGQQFHLFMSPETVEEEQGKDYYGLEPCEKPEVVEAWKWGDVPDFCTDPAAADLVRVEIERRGWMLTRIDYRSMRPLPAYPSQHRAQILTDKAISSDGHWGASDDSPAEALCLAFLAAHDAQEAKP